MEPAHRAGYRRFSTAPWGAEQQQDANMDKRALADQLLAELGDTLTLRELKLDEATNSCILLFEGDLVLNIEFDDASGRLLFSPTSASCPRKTPSLCCAS